METLGFRRRIREARERSNMPQAELGHRIGLSAGTVELVERGLRPFPKNLFGAWMTTIGIDTDIALAEYLVMIGEEVCRMSGLREPIFNIYPVTKKETQCLKSNHGVQAAVEQRFAP